MEEKENQETPQLFTAEQVNQIVAKQVEFAIQDAFQSLQALQFRVETYTRIIENNNYPQDMKEEALAKLWDVIKPINTNKEQEDEESKSE